MTKNKTMALLAAGMMGCSLLLAAGINQTAVSQKSDTVATDSVAADSLAHATQPADSLAAETAGDQKEPVIYQTGKATHYGDKWHGRKCASGERYNKDDYTCAHRTLPFGTLIKVTNTRNGQSAVVRVIDRGPFGKGKVIDLSKAAARKIGMLGHGIVPVTLEIVEPGTPVLDGEIVTEEELQKAKAETETQQQPETPDAEQ